MRFINTPGHTLESVCLIIGQEGKEEFVFTGDTLFCGDVGRPDLAQDNAKKVTLRDLSDKLYESIQRLKKLDDDCVVFPCHGSGSPCGKKISSETSSTIGKEKENNKALMLDNPEDFFKEVTNGISPPP